MSQLRGFFLTAALALLSPDMLSAQGSATGRVVDAASGRAIVAAEVRLEGRDTLAVRTGPDGRWSVTALPYGGYQLMVRAIGYVANSGRLIVAGAAAAPTVTALDAAVLSLDQLVVTAARRAQRLGDAVTTVEVVSRAEIERTGASDLASVLVEQTGVELQGGHPAGAGVMLQGFGSERVLVLLDGQPVSGRLAGVFDISRIPPSAVERIEVVKGAQSTLYGSEAMGGVVNIITRTPGEGTLGVGASATAGSQGRRDGTVTATLGRGDISSSFDVSRRQVETAPGRDGADGALSARVDGSAKLRWSPGPLHSVEASVLALDERQRWRSGSFHNFSDNVQLNARLGGSITRGRHRLRPGIWTSSYDHVSRASVASLPVAGDTGQRQVQRVHQAELLYDARFGKSVALDLGTQLRVDEIETERVPGGLRSLTTLEPFAQLELTALPRTTLLPGVRVTRSSEWGTHVSPRVAARVRATDRLTLRASMGDGFRAPDFKELFMFFQNMNADYAILGNPDLKPEKSRSTMLGAEWAMPTGFVRAQLFHNAFSGFIETRPVAGAGASPVYRYANVDDGSTRGLELEAGSNLGTRGGLRLEGGYSHLATRNDATGEALLGRPTHAARASVGARLPLRFRASLGAFHTGSTPMQRDDSTGAITSRRDAYTRVDVRLARAIPSVGLEFALGADNLFDRRPSQWAGFTGRHVYTALSWNLSRTTAR